MVLGQGQPARHRRAVLGILAGEGGPQFPVGLGAAEQAAEQRVPLLGLVTGQTGAGIAVHGLLEQFAQAREDIGQP
ncbi:hypothetical protein D3C77_790700 [compost metagenome]